MRPILCINGACRSKITFRLAYILILVHANNRASFRNTMQRLIELRYNRIAADKVAFMVLTATPTDDILDTVYGIVGFIRHDNHVLYIRKSLNRPNIFLEVRKKKDFDVSILAFIS